MTSFGKTEASALRITFNLDISKARAMKKIGKTASGPENMNLDMSMAIYGNGGRTNLYPTSRASRFYGFVLGTFS